MQGLAAGTVYAYNYEKDHWYTCPPCTWQQGPYMQHDAGSIFNLNEGNQIEGVMISDDIHGSSGLNTWFRNLATGHEAGKTQQTNGISIQAADRGLNAIGNLLGDASYHTVYEKYTGDAGGTTNCDVAVYQLGYGGTECSTGTRWAEDVGVRGTLLRWGNCDAVHGFTPANCQFVNSEIPATGQPNYTAKTYIASNAIPGSHTLPSSFYLSSKPVAWWGNQPWPAIGPDITGGTGYGGMLYNIPAKVCYDATPKVSGILRFDASSCYPAAAVPPATTPRILSILSGWNR